MISTRCLSPAPRSCTRRPNSTCNRYRSQSSEISAASSAPGNLPSNRARYFQEQLAHQKRQVLKHHANTGTFRMTWAVGRIWFRLRSMSRTGFRIPYIIFTKVTYLRHSHRAARESPSSTGKSTALFAAKSPKYLVRPRTPIHRFDEADNRFLFATESVKLRLIPKYTERIQHSPLQTHGLAIVRLEKEIFRADVSVQCDKPLLNKVHVLCENVWSQTFKISFFSATTILSSESVETR